MAKEPLEKEIKGKVPLISIEVGIVVALLCIIFFLAGLMAAGRIGGAKEDTQSSQEPGTAAGHAPASDLAHGKITPHTKPLQVDPGAVESKDEEPQAMQVPSGYEVVMNTDWYFPEGSTSSSNAYVENSRTNKTPVFFTVELYDSPGEKIFTSEVLSVGEILTDIRIDRSLSKGVHNGRVVYYLLGDGNKISGTVEMDVRLHIGEDKPK